MILVEISLQLAIPLAAGLGSCLLSLLPTATNIRENVPGELEKPRNCQVSPQISLPRADLPGNPALHPWVSPPAPMRGGLCITSKPPAKAPISVFPSS